MACNSNSSGMCGGSNRLRVYSYNLPYTAAQLPPVISGNYKLKGCFSDNVNVRSLNASSFHSPTLTDESCVTNCQLLGYSLAGVEYGDECCCDNALVSTSALTNITDCQGMFCAGNSTEFYGSANRLLVYSAFCANTSKINTVDFCHVLLHCNYASGHLDNV